MQEGLRRADLTLWDDTGVWQGIPEVIAAAAYGGLTEADQERLEKTTPTLSRTQ